VMCSDNTLYCGCTTNLPLRIRVHNLKKGAKYTRGRCPVKVVAFVENLSHGDALRLERKIKSLHKDEKVPFLKRYKPTR